MFQGIDERTVMEPAARELYTMEMQVAIDGSVRRTWPTIVQRKCCCTDRVGSSHFGASVLPGDGHSCHEGSRMRGSQCTSPEGARVLQLGRHSTGFLGCAHALLVLKAGGDQWLYLNEVLMRLHSRQCVVLRCSTNTFHHFQMPMVRVVAKRSLT